MNDLEKIPQVRIDMMARPVLKAVKRYFEDPEVIREFEKWLAERAERMGEVST